MKGYETNLPGGLNSLQGNKLESLLLEPPDDLTNLQHTVSTTTQHVILYLFEIYVLFKCMHYYSFSSPIQYVTASTIKEGSFAKGYIRIEAKTQSRGVMKGL